MTALLTKVSESMARAKYNVLQSLDHFIIIEDLNQGVSITNDAEAVVKEVVDLYGDKRIRYYDTDGRFDELVHNHSQFVDFIPVTGNHELDDARWVEKRVRS